MSLFLNKNLIGKYLIWDFDGTLAYRHGRWGGTLVEILRQNYPAHPATREDFREALATGFPWHESHRPHTHIGSDDEWWNALHPVFVNAFRSVGFDDDSAIALAQQVRGQYSNLDYWQLFDDSVDTLAELSGLGWTHIILSNHVPELGNIVAGLGLGGQISRIFNSAATGFEKPHPDAWKGLMESIEADAVVWMIGDNPLADIAGAEQIGIPAILVRSEQGARYCCSDLRGVRAFLEAGE